MNDTTIESKRTCKPTKDKEASESTRSTFVSTYPENTHTIAANNPRAETTSNEYVLNFAFLSFFIFMTIQAFFAIAAKSQSMLADSMAMSVDAFTYLFNLAAERLKHRSPHHFQYLSLEETKRRKKIIRLYLEFIPPMISVCALVVVSTQALLDAVSTIIGPPEMSGDSSVGVAKEEPNINIMLIFSSLNLGLDLLNVICFSKVQNFSLTGDLTVKDDDESKQNLCGLDEEEIPLTKDENFESESPKNRRSPSKVREFPPSIVVDLSIDSSFGSNDSGGIGYDEDPENDGLLGIVMPNYGSQRSDSEWGDEFSFGGVHGGGSESDGLTSEAVSVTSPSLETGDSLSLGSGAASAFSNSSRRSKALDIGIGGENLDGISEGDENSSGDNNGLCEVSDGNASNDGNDSETSGRGFNLNMCSAYTHVMADTLRSIAVLIASGISYIFHVEPALADSTAAVIVSVIIALSLGPLVVGLFQTWNELQALKREQNESKDGHVEVPWSEQYQHLPSVSPRISRRS